jgi:type I restriction-modification system DNA methylase subunit
MTESNNVRFAEDNGKWIWKCYDANGSVTHRSQLFNSEKEAREDYELNGGQYKASSTQPEVPAQDQGANIASDTVPQNPKTPAN